VASDITDQLLTVMYPAATSAPVCLFSDETRPLLRLLADVQSSHGTSGLTAWPRSGDSMTANALVLVTAENGHHTLEIQLPPTEQSFVLWICALAEIHETPAQRPTAGIGILDSVYNKLRGFEPTPEPEPEPEPGSESGSDDATQAQALTPAAQIVPSRTHASRTVKWDVAFEGADERSTRTFGVGSGSEAGTVTLRVTRGAVRTRSAWGACTEEETTALNHWAPFVFVAGESTSTLWKSLGEARLASTETELAKTEIAQKFAKDTMRAVEIHAEAMKPSGPDDISRTLVFPLPACEIIPDVYPATYLARTPQDDAAVSALLALAVCGDTAPALAGTHQSGVFCSPSPVVFSAVVDRLPPDALELLGAHLTNQHTDEELAQSPSDWLQGLIHHTRAILEAYPRNRKLGLRVTANPVKIEYGTLGVAAAWRECIRAGGPQAVHIAFQQLMSPTPPATGESDRRDERRVELLAMPGTQLAVMECIPEVYTRGRSPSPTLDPSDIGLSTLEVILHVLSAVDTPDLATVLAYACYLRPGGTVAASMVGLPKTAPFRVFSVRGAQEQFYGALTPPTDRDTLYQFTNAAFVRQFTFLVVDRYSAYRWVCAVAKVLYTEAELARNPSFAPDSPSFRALADLDSKKARPKNGKAVAAPTQNSWLPAQFLTEDTTAVGPTRSLRPVDGAWADPPSPLNSLFEGRLFRLIGRLP
jgi:hypothetical protein